MLFRSPETVTSSLSSFLDLAKRSGDSIKLLAVRSFDSTIISATSTLENTLSKRQNDATNPNWKPGDGVIPPTSVPTGAIFAIFGIIGAGFVITAIWFFMIAPNGGFVFREGDWEDYKSTVLRRKGPNGTTLSGATESTMLGGGSVVGRRERRRYRDKLGSSDVTESTAWTKSDLDDSTVVSSEMDAMTSITRGVSGGYRREKVEKSNKAIKKEEERRLKEQRKREKEDAKRAKMTKRYDEESSVGFEESVYDEHEHAIRSYREERPARVGGMNREADGSGFETSTYISSEATESLIGGEQSAPQYSPKKERTRRYKDSVYSEVMIESPSPTKKRDGPGIRKVDTVYEADRIKAEARRLRDKGRAAEANRAATSSEVPKRNFSFAPGDDVSAVSEESRNERNERRERRRRERAERDQRNIPGTFAEESEVSGLTASTETSGTKSYHHPIPGLGSAAGAGGDSYAEERRRRRQEGANYKR